VTPDRRFGEESRSIRCSMRPYRGECASMECAQASTQRCHGHLNLATFSSMRRHDLDGGWPMLERLGVNAESLGVALPRCHQSASTCTPASPAGSPSPATCRSLRRCQRRCRPRTSRPWWAPASRVRAAAERAWRRPPGARSRAKNSVRLSS